MFMRNIASKPILSVFLYAGLGLQGLLLYALSLQNNAYV